MTNNNDLNGQIPVMKRKWLNFQEVDQSTIM
jgi:hypothetical protein